MVSEKKVNQVKLQEVIVLILVVVEDGLGVRLEHKAGEEILDSLNPCCSGRWSRRIHGIVANELAARRS